MPERKQRLQPKYVKESRGCYGVACPKIDGVVQPTMMIPWDYTEKKLLSALQADKVYKTIDIKYSNWKGKDAKGCKAYKGNLSPFHDRYGDNWATEIKNTIFWQI